MNRIIYNVQGLYFSPYPGEQGENNNEGNYFLSGFNILKKIEKIQNINYTINSKRINQIVSKNLLYRGFDYPTVDLDFSYIQQQPYLALTVCSSMMNHFDFILFKSELEIEVSKLA